MSPSDLPHVLTEVISGLLAENRSYFGAGGPGYYGVRADNVSPDGSEFDVILTFRAGTRYCCVEWGCHLPLYSAGNCEGWFGVVRDGLAEAGVEVPPMTMRNLHVVVEEGAMSDDDDHKPVPHDSVLEYDAGPFYEIGSRNEKAGS